MAERCAPFSFWVTMGASEAKRLWRIHIAVTVNSEREGADEADEDPTREQLPGNGKPGPGKRREGALV
jgi:hypothetical protein